MNFFIVNLPQNIDFNFNNNVDYIGEIEAIAELLRSYWALGKGPICDIVGILENNGFIISKIPNKVKQVEAFSVWYEKVPYIFYEGNRSTSVSYIFSICHELGHLILHQSLTDDDVIDAFSYKLLEKQAYLFAGAFLMPAETFGNEYLTSNLQSFIAIKRKWNVSLGAMIMRAHALNIIDDKQEKYLFRQLNRHGYRLHEPFDDEIRFSAPSMLFNAIKIIIENGIVNMRDFIDEVALPKDELVSICSLPDNYVENNLGLHRDSPHLRVVH